MRNRSVVETNIFKSVFKNKVFMTPVQSGVEAGSVVWRHKEAPV